MAMVGIAGSRGLPYGGCGGIDLIVVGCGVIDRIVVGRGGIDLIVVLIFSPGADRDPPVAVAAAADRPEKQQVNRRYEKSADEIVIVNAMGGRIIRGGNG